MNHEQHEEISTIPREARSHQGASAGLVTRVAANVIDCLIVGSVVLGAYAAYAAVRLVVAPRSFEVPDPSLQGVVLVCLCSAVFYLSAMWWITGRTFGAQVMGIRVVGARQERLRLLQAWARAVLCVGFPPGLLWCVVGPRRRSVQDLLLRTAVVYDWLPRPPRPEGDQHRDVQSPGD